MGRTPTHMNKVLDGYQQVFIKMRPSDEDELHNYKKSIVRSACAFWRQSGHRLEITLSTLLDRGIVTSRAIVEHILAERGPQGCDSMPVWNLMHSVARKSLESSQLVRAELAVAKRLGKTDVVER